MMGVDTEELNEAGRRLNSFAIHLLRAMRRVDAESGLTPARLSALSVLHFGGPRTLGRLARDEDDGSLRLGEAGEIVEVAVVTIWVVRVTVAHALGRGGDHGDATPHGPKQTRAAFGEGLIVHCRHRSLRLKRL